MFTAILWDYDGTLANTPVKNIAVTRAVLGRLDPALLDPLPEALSSLAAYQAANYRWRNWRELYQHALRVPADRLDEAGALWGPCQLADRTLPPLFGGLLEVLPRLAALAPMGICSQNDSGNIRAALAAHGAADCFAAAVYREFEGHMLPLPQGYDTYLKIAFGDYMTPPPPEKQAAHHDVSFVDLDHSYLDYKHIRYACDRERKR